MSIQYTIGTRGNTGAQGPSGSSLFTITSNTINFDTPYIFNDLLLTANTSTQFKYTMLQNSLNIGFNNIINGKHTIVSGSNHNSSFNSNLIIGGSSNAITAYNSIIFGGLTNTINNSNNSLVLSGSSNQILNSPNSSIVGSNITISNANNSFGLGNGSVINTPYSFVWSDSTPRTNNIAKSVYFGCANGFTVNLNNTSGITITSNAILPLTNANMSIGSSALSFSNLYMITNTSNIITSNSLYIYNQTTTLMNFTSTQIILHSSLKCNDLGLPLSTTSYFTSVFFANNGGILYNNSPILSFTPTVMNLNASIIPKFNQLYSLGTTTTDLNALYVYNQDPLYDSCVYLYTTSQTYNAATDNAISWNSVEIANKLTPANITLSASNRFYNTSGRTRKWWISVEFMHSGLSVRPYVWIHVYNSAGTLLYNYVCHSGLIISSANATMCTCTNGVVTLNSNDYIIAWEWHTANSLTTNPSFDGRAASRICISEIN